MYFVLFFIIPLVANGFVIVNTKQGKIQGFHKKSYDGRTYTAFEGIPYGKPPIGNLRFKEPQPVSSWSGILTANKTYLCPQLDETFSFAGTEDCLHLFVHVPKKSINIKDNLDVIVHIHGGSLTYGGAQKMAQPDYLMDKNVILVTINYRLGAAGFLSTGNKDVWGNNGYKDQVLALKWIKDNIKSFGGNPKSITLTGFSAGSASVHFHYISPLSKGMFHRGFSMSAVVTTPGSLTLDPLKNAKQLAVHLRCPTENIKNMVKCLRQQPIQKLVEKTFWFKPAVEKGNPLAFLPDIPYKMLREKQFANDVPWVVSNVANEEGFTLDSLYKNSSEIFAICSNWNEFAKSRLDLENYVDENKLDETLTKIKEFYLKDCKFKQGEALEKMIRLLSDRHFLVGTDLAIRTHSTADAKSSVYYYFFKFIPDDRLEFFGPPVASHGVDTKLMFKFKTNPERLKPKSEKMMRILTEFLAHYAKTGIPIIKNTTWSPLTPNDPLLNVLEINSPEDIKMVKMKELAPMAFWNSLPIKENQNLL